MKAFKVKLSDFLESVYKVQINDYLDFNEFYFDFSWVKAEQDDINRAIKLLNIDRDKAEAVVVRAMCDAYEESYYYEYIKEVQDRLEKKIEKDFSKLPEFFSEELEYAGYKNVEPLNIKINWENDEIIFSGMLKQLDVYMVECLNGYGLFTFNSYKEFIDYCGENIKGRFLGHMHWLKELESIYGSIYYFFKCNLEDIDRYGCLGNTDYSDEALKECLEYVA